MPIDPPQIGRDAIASPRVRALLDWWKTRRGEHKMPARSDFVSEELAAWWPDIILYEVETVADGSRLFRFRVHGANVIQADGVNYTGRHLAEVIPAEYRATTLDFYEAMVDRGQPLYSTGHRILRSGMRMAFERLLLPLGGERVTHVLALLLWQLPKPVDEIDALAEENLPFVIDILGFVAS